MVNKKGFSLIELVIVVGLITLLSLVIASIMLTTIVSSNRIRTITKVKQSGNYVLGQTQALLRSAKSVSSCTTTSGAETGQISIVNFDGGQTEIALDDTDSTRIASNSGTFLTPANITVSNFTLTCLPSETEPTLVKLSFELKDRVNTKDRENPILHFETSINLRNE